MSDLSGRAVIVTGAASGIGRAITERLVDDGADVLAVDLEPDRGRARAMPHAADLTTREGNRGAVEAALERFGRLDAIVPNAGFQHVSPVADFPEDRWDALISLLLTSPFLLAKYGWEALQGERRRALRGHRLGPRAGGVAVQGGLRLGQARRARPRARRWRSRAPTPASWPPPSARRSCARRSWRSRSPDQAKAHGLPEDRVLDEVILAPHAVKRLIEPEEVAGVVSFLLGPEGRAFTGSPVTMDLGWTAR